MSIANRKIEKAADSLQETDLEVAMVLLRQSYNLEDSTLTKFRRSALISFIDKAASALNTMHDPCARRLLASKIADCRSAL